MSDDANLPVKPKTNLRAPWGWELPNLTREGADWLDTWFSRRGLSAAESAPRVCSRECSFLRQCPLEALQIPLPLACPCPVEATLIEEFSTKMKASLGIEDDDLWSLMLLEYGAMWKLHLHRAMSESGSDRVVIESYRGIDKDGNALYELKVNPTLSFARDVQKILQSIGRDLIATREAKAKLSQMKAAMGPEEFLRSIDAKFTASDADVEEKTQKIRDKRKRIPETEPDRPSVPHVNTDGLKP